jgi:DNA polymerase
LAQIRDDLGECTRCKLAPTRTRLVFGDGSPSADLVFVGEAPGHDEDQQGLPFVGAAGEMLTRMITNVLRLRRDQVYIGNLLKCRPPANRDPQPDEITMCTPFLDRQLASIGPRLIVALGRPAAQFLLGTTEPVGRLRGQVHHRGDVPVIVTYHPAYLLRSPHEKRKAMDDLQQIRAVLQQATGVELPPPLSGREAREH